MSVSQRVWTWGWSPRPRIHFAIALIMTIIACALFSVSSLYTYRLLTQNPVVDGSVVKSASGAQGFHTPIIEYRSLAGEVRRFKSKLSSRPQAYFIGDSVKVILVGEESTPKLKSFFSVYGLSAFLLSFALICALGSTVIYFTRVRSNSA